MWEAGFTFKHTQISVVVMYFPCAIRSLYFIGYRNWNLLWQERKPAHPYGLLHSTSEVARMLAILSSWIDILVVITTKTLCTECKQLWAINIRTIATCFNGPLGALAWPSWDRDAKERSDHTWAHHMQKRGRYHQEPSPQLITLKSQIFPFTNSSLQSSDIFGLIQIFNLQN